METIEKPKNLIAKIVVGLIIIFLVVIFSLQNSDATPVKFFGWEGDAPLVLLFLLCFVLGLSFSLVAIYPLSRYSKRKSKMISELNTRINMLETQLKEKQQGKNEI
jgi:uncharacterized integral membrane protein